MPRIILKSNYLKAQSKNTSGFLKYIATRAGVVKYTSDSGLLPATKKQKDFIVEFLELYPESNTLFEYEDYQKNPTRENASAFIASATEYYLLGEKQSNPELYAKYVATRPNSQKINTHGLFGMTENISLTKSMEELKQHKGNVWTHIVSIRREDAERLGYDKVKPWVNLVRSHSAELAKQMKIKPHNLVWCGAFHDESYHPHIHLMVYSKDESEGYLTKTGINKLRGAFAQTIFKQDLISVYDRQTTAREGLKQELVDALLELEEVIATGDFNQEPLKTKFIKLAEDLSQRKKGKNTYGYLPRVLKAQVDELLDLFAGDERIGNCYKEWNTLRQEVLGTYQDKEVALLPLSEQKEFHHLKNIILKNAVEYIHPEPPSLVAEAADTSPIMLDENLTLSLSEEEPYQTIQNTQDPKKMVELLKQSADQKNPYAEYQYGLYLKETLSAPDYNRSGYRYLSSAFSRFVELELDSEDDMLSYRIGKMLMDGIGVKADTDQAMHYFEKAAQLKNPHAIMAIIKNKVKNDSPATDLNPHLTTLRELADNQNPSASYFLGKLLEDGSALEKNDKKAIHYYQQAADSNSYASYRLGRLLLESEQMEPDIQAGIGWLEESAEFGNPYAQYKLATLFLSGELVEKDIPKALSYLQMASQQGNEPACYLLGKMYEQGEFVEKEEAKAFRLYSKVAEKNSYAAYRLGNLIVNSSELTINPSVGIYWLEKSAGMGNELSWYQLGKHYSSGELIGQDMPRALFYLEKAAETNNSFALYELAKLYLYGIGVDKDEGLGMEYLLHSIRLGNEYAELLLERHQTPKTAFAFQNIFKSFQSLFSAPPSSASGGAKPSVIDRKLRSKIKRKKIALGHAEDDEMTMKG